MVLASVPAEPSVELEVVNAVDGISVSLTLSETREQNKRIFDSLSFISMTFLTFVSWLVSTALGSNYTAGACYNSR